MQCSSLSSVQEALRRRRRLPPSMLALVLLCFMVATQVCGASELDKADKFLDKVNLEQSIAAVFNKVAYGHSTTKRSIPDNVYPVTTLATPLLTTYRYSDGNDEWLRVDVKKPEPDDDDDSGGDRETGRSGGGGNNGYGSELEKDHGLPTSAPAADILKNNNNKHYSNPNRYNNDRLRPHSVLDEYGGGPQDEVTERNFRTSTGGYNVLRNVKPTKSMYSKDVPSYVPPSRSFFTPPLPPEYVNPFADKPTLRGTNSDSFANRRPIPPPSLMPSKDRIPFRPDLPPGKAPPPDEQMPPLRIRNGTAENGQGLGAGGPNGGGGGGNSGGGGGGSTEKKKTLNTPSQVINFDRVGEFYGLNRMQNETFEYEKVNIPSITRILSGSNGRKEDIPDILLRTVTAPPQRREPMVVDPPRSPAVTEVIAKPKDAIPVSMPPRQQESATVRKEAPSRGAVGGGGGGGQDRSDRNDRGGGGGGGYIGGGLDLSSETERNVMVQQDMTTENSDILNLPNVKEKERSNKVTVSNATKSNSHEIWQVCWNVHVYLVVFVYILLAVFSIYKLVCYEKDPHMFSKSYFLTVHLLLTVVCVLRIFYLTYDPYNVGESFNVFLYDLLHNFPLSLLAATFAILVVFLLKRTLTHLKVQTRPIFLVVFALFHMTLCVCLSVAESLGMFGRLSPLGLVCRLVFVLLCWALGFSYMYLYRIIKNVLAKKSQNLSEMCSQNISYASHITIAVALLFVLLGVVQLYALVSIKVDRFVIPYHWILWGFELSVRFLEISIITLLAIVVSLKMSQREKQTVGFPLFPCTTSDSSTDNIYPSNCSTNPNAMHYSRHEMPMEPMQQEIKNPVVDRPQAAVNNLDRFERPKWGSERSSEACNSSTLSQYETRSSGRKTYEPAKYYTKPKYDLEYSNEDYQRDLEDHRMAMNNWPHHQQQQHHQLHNQQDDHSSNVYSEPLDQHEYDLEAGRRSRNSNTSGRRSTGRSGRKNQARPHLGVQTLPNHDSMLVDENGFVRFRHLAEMDGGGGSGVNVAGGNNTGTSGKQPTKKIRTKPPMDVNHYSDA